MQYFIHFAHTVLNDMDIAFLGQIVTHLLHPVHLFMSLKGYFFIVIYLVLIVSMSLILALPFWSL